MIKYFIEDSEGRWLSNPEERGETWTRDPMKAWTFNQDLDIIPYTGKSIAHNSSAIVLMWLMEEDCCPGCLFTEHEYQDLGPDRTTWKHQIQRSRLFIYPPGTTHYLTMYHKGVCMTNNSQYNTMYNQGVIVK